MTDEQKAAYLASGGAVCPHCKSFDIEADDIEVDGPAASCEVVCNTCLAEWRDYYRLFDVRGESPPVAKRSDS